VALAVIEEANAAHRGRVVTELQPVDNYSRAEDYHQRYFQKNPHQGYCAAVVAPKVEKFRKTFKARLKA
jgi:peptide-methionine (S)-S-oxide reductase